jgi:hypothetical protein
MRCIIAAKNKIISAPVRCFSWEEIAMQWLTALLAFAVTMLIFAIIVSTFVEMIHRAFGFRKQGMRLMLESLFDRVIKDRVQPADNLDAAKFASIIMENRALSSEKPEERGLLRRFLHWLVDSSVVTDMPVEVFTQKLADNKVVKAIDGDINTIITDIGQKFEAFSDEASEYFTRRARVFSVIIAFFVAWGFYVHPYQLAVAYVKNPELAQTVAEKADETHAQYREIAAKLEETLKAGTASAEDTEQLKDLMKEFNTKIDDSAATTKELADIGVPVGWPENMKSCAEVKQGPCFQGYIPWPGLGNAFWLIVGGLLVGLGAPFWAQAVSNLSALRDVTRKITDVVAPERVTGGGMRTRGIGPGPTSTAVATFTFARKADAQPAAVQPAPPPPAGGKPKQP